MLLLPLSARAIVTAWPRRAHARLMLVALEQSSDRGLVFFFNAIALVTYPDFRTFSCKKMLFSLLAATAAVYSAAQYSRVFCGATVCCWQISIGAIGVLLIEGFPVFRLLKMILRCNFSQPSVHLSAIAKLYSV